jgi:hypothetical protein
MRLVSKVWSADVTQHRCRSGPAGPVGTVFFMLCLVRVCAAAEFSADIVSRDAAGVQVGGVAKLYVADDKVRIETPEASTGFFLIDGKRGTAVFVRPTQQIYTDARQSSRLTRLFVPVDADNPCPQWQAAAQNAGVPDAEGEWHCERIEAGTVDDRSTTECRVMTPDQDSSRRWIDSSLGFPVRVWMSDGASFALENIRIAAQSAQLFAIPPTYRKLDPHALIERIKHSDVWVESPN